MKVHGIPDTFWLVTSSTPHSDLGDVCFECDFERFALQIRGGLDEKAIIGIFADRTEAVELAEKLLQSIQQPETLDIRIHKSPWPAWFATQESLASIVICSKTSGEKVTVEPPMEWGRHWAWNTTEDGSGIVIQRTK